MNQFRIKGIDYADDSLQHGLGKGSGRGRPVGSKNGQVMPGAAYMKDYKVVGEKAQGDANQTQVTRRTSGGANRIDPYGSGGRQQRTGTRVIGTANARANNQQQSAGRARTATGTNRIASGSVITNSGRVIPTQDMRTKSTPAATTSKGKDAVTKMMEYNGTQMGSGRTTSNGAYKYDTPRPQQRVVEEVPAQQNNSQLHAPDRQVNKPINGQGQQNDNRIHAPNQAAGQQNQNPNQNPVDRNVNRATDWNVFSNQIQPQPSNAGTGDNGNIQPDRPVSDAGKGETDNQKKETPEQKSFWDRLGGWFNQAGKDIGDTVSGAWNTATGAVNDAAVWVGDRLKDGGEWALASMGDVGKWVGDRGRDLDVWWNGRDVTGSNGQKDHYNGARDDIGNALNAAGKWIGDQANAVGQGVSNFVNGVRPGEAQPYYDVKSGKWVDPTMPSLGERIQGGVDTVRQGLSNFGQAAADTATNAWNGVTGAANDFRQNAGNFLNDAGQWINDGVVTPVVNGFNSGVDFVRNTTNDIGNRMATGASTSRALDSGVAPSEVETYQRMLSDGSINQDTYNNVMNSMANIQNIDRAAAQAGWDGIPADVREMNEKENNSLGQRIGNAAQNAWNGISDTAQNVANGVSNAAQNVWNGANEAYRNLVGGVYPVTNPDGTTHNLYYPTLKDAYDTVAGNNVPSYVEKYYDRSNPDREAYWPMTMQYIQRQDPTYFWSDPSSSSVFNFHPVNYAVAKYGNNPFEDKK